MTLAETLTFRFANPRLEPLPAGPDEEAPLMLSDTLLASVEVGALSEQDQPAQLFTGHFVLADSLKAYATFSQAMRERALKVIITAD